MQRHSVRLRVPRIAQDSRVEFLSGLATIDDTTIAPIDLPHLLTRNVTDHENADVLAA